MIMAIDQQAMDEHVRTTDDLDHVDDFMGRMFRNDSRGKEPVISPNVSKRCEISMTRPTTIPGVSCSQLDICGGAYTVKTDMLCEMPHHYFPLN